MYNHWDHKHCPKSALFSSIFIYNSFEQIRMYFVLRKIFGNMTKELNYVEKEKIIQR